jgi:hypothetical protein
VQVALTDATFKTASWDWVQNPTTATSKWHAIGDWDVSGVADFTRAFTKDRDVAGAFVADNNPKAAFFVGTGLNLENWITSSVINLLQMFKGAAAFNADISGWDVSRVSNFNTAFNACAEFEGTGLGKWAMTEAITLVSTFYGASKFNADLGAWAVQKVTNLQNTFRAANFAGTGLDKWNVNSVIKMTSTFDGAASLTTCNKRKIAHAWASNTAFTDTTYDTAWAGEPWCVGAALSDAEFKTASWDWVQDTATATSKWGAIGDWDVSAVADFSYAFSKDRNAAGGSDVANGNSANIASFTGAGLDKWSTVSATTLRDTFKYAGSMNVNLGSWDVTKVTTMYHTFFFAVKFVGEGLESWNVAAVTDMESTFRDAHSFIGTGLGKWTTGPLTSVYHTFMKAGAMNADVGGWDVSKVGLLHLREPQLFARCTPYNTSRSAFKKKYARSHTRRTVLPSPGSTTTLMLYSTRAKCLSRTQPKPYMHAA